MAHPRTGPAVPGLAGRLGGLEPGLVTRAVARRLLEERERWFTWFPVALGTGIGAYFALPAEPPAWPAPLALAISLLLVLWGWRGVGLRAPAGALPWLIGVLGLALGFTVAQTRTHAVDAPVLPREGVHEVEGRVVLVEDRERGLRVVIERPVIERLAPEATPFRIRVSLRAGGPELHPGDRIRVLAMLMPPSGPTLPGGFDFARQAFFERLGAVGYAYGHAQRLEAGRPSGAAEHLARLRQRVADAVTAAVPGETGAVATALLTGLRAAIPDHIWRDMQTAGLAHLLAISGLHLGLVAGTLFCAIRYGLLLVPTVALRLPTKKIAAAGALVGAFVYMLLAGAPVPTQRAFFMTGVALIAVMVERNPLSMRLVAWAALVVLLLRPESLLGASFQMSFAAVVALIAVYETGRARLVRASETGALRRAAVYLSALALTTLVASTATAPLAGFHFQRIATFGIVANLVAVPVTAFWIMPTGLLGLLAMPFGLEAPAFVVMGHGIDVVLTTAAWAARLPAAALDVAQWPTASLAAFALGGLWLCLWRRPWRLAGAAGIALGLALALQARPPDLIVAAGANVVAVRMADGSLALSPWSRDAYVTGDWLRRSGRREPAPWPEEGDGVPPLRCDALGCVLELHGHHIALARRPEALAEDCARADLVLGLAWAARCPPGARFLGPSEIAATGGLALRIAAGGLDIEEVQAHRGRRPWTR